MEWAAVISLIVVGVILIVVEIIFVPGTTIVGIIGLCITIAGIVMGFLYFGRSTGWIILASTGIATGLTIVLTLRGKAWERFALDSAIDSRVNEGALTGMSVGDEGVAVSALRPGGKAEFSGKLFEVSTLGNFAESGTKVRIIRITSNQLIVEPFN